MWFAPFGDASSLLLVIRRFHDLRSFHQRLLRVGPLRGPEVTCETSVFDCWIYIVKNMNMFEQMPFSEKYPVFRKLAEIGDLRKLSREELELYDEDIKNMRDIYATRKFDEKRGMAKGRAKGRAEGLAEGLAKGELSKGLEVARNLLAMGMSWTQIIQATGLTEDQLKQLQS